MPGSFISIAKELSALPCVRDTNFAENLRKAYQNGIGTGKSQLDFGAFNCLFEGASSKVDMRTEMAVAGELKRQAIPVIINELLVRGLYFVRRFILQMKDKQSLSDLDWRKVLPAGNRTIARMMTIATGTFVAVDMADATIRSAIKSGGITNPMFMSNVILNVNFVGVGRFAIAVGADAGMGIKKMGVERKRGEVVGGIIGLSNVKLYYLNADLMCDYSTLHEKEAEMHVEEANMWIEVENTQQSMEQLYYQIENVGKFFGSTIAKMDENFEEIERLLPEVETMNPGLIDEMFGRLSR